MATTFAVARVNTSALIPAPPATGRIPRPRRPPRSRQRDRLGNEAPGCGGCGAGRRPSRSLLGFYSLADTRQHVHRSGDLLRLFQREIAGDVVAVGVDDLPQRRVVAAGHPLYRYREFKSVEVAHPIPPLASPWPGAWGNAGPPLGGTSPESGRREGVFHRVKVPVNSYFHVVKVHGREKS